MQKTVNNVAVRQPEAGDEAAMASLFGQLGYPATAASLLAGLTQQTDSDMVLLAVDDASVLGVLVWHRMQPLHVAPAWGLISALVVDEGARGAGVGAALLKGAEAMARAAGCVQLELSSSLKREAAHRFYLAQDYQERPKRFVKLL